MSLISMPLRASYTLLRRRIRSQWRNRFARLRARWPLRGQRVNVHLPRNKKGRPVTESPRPHVKGTAPHVGQAR